MKRLASKKNTDPTNNEEAVIPPEEQVEDTVTAASADAAAEPEKAPERDLEAELAAEHDRYLRLAAEYDNFRKRNQKEREALYTDIRSDTILKLLPVYDNLARALSHETADEAYKKGVEMTMNQFRDILGKMGVSEITAVGETFDPLRHNAVMHVEDERYGENIVIEEFEKGFMLGDKVIRFSMVKVAN